MSHNLKFSVSALILVCMTISISAADPGVVFWRTMGTHLYHENVPYNAPHQYYPNLEGPSWENHYCTWRMYIDQDNRNAIDLTGKYHYEPTLSNYDKTCDVHADNPWGTDILEIGNTLGCGPFRLIHGDNTWKKPEIGGNLDSLVVDIIDSTYESPKLRLSYWGWDVGSGQKLDVFWTIETRKMMRPTVCKLKIEGALSNTKVVVGMSKAGGAKTEDSENGNLITLGKQSQQGDSLLMAIHAEPNYFEEFTSNSANHAMVLIPDDSQTVKWAIMHSWVKEPDPVFHKEGWKDELFNDLDSIPEFRKEITHTIPKNKKTNVTSSVARYRYSGNWAIYTLNGKKVQDRSNTTFLNTLSPQKANGLYILKANNHSNTHIHSICDVN